MSSRAVFSPRGGRPPEGLIFVGKTKTILREVPREG